MAGTWIRKVVVLVAGGVFFASAASGGMVRFSVNATAPPPPAGGAQEGRAAPSLLPQPPVISAPLANATPLAPPLLREDSLAKNASQPPLPLQELPSSAPTAGLPSSPAAAVPNASIEVPKASAGPPASLPTPAPVAPKEDHLTREAAHGTSLSQAPSSVSAPKDGRPAQEVSVPSLQSLYQAAMAAYTGRRYVEARQLWQRVLELYPKSALLPNARYWIGETWYAQGRLLQAIWAWELVLHLYPRHPKAADALFKIALTRQRLGEMDLARSLWRQVVAQYPGTRAAWLASQHLGDRL